MTKITDDMLLAALNAQEKMMREVGGYPRPDAVRRLEDWSGHSRSVMRAALEAASAAADDVVPDSGDLEAYAEQFREYLGQEMYVCGRHPSTLGIGTMGLNDFMPAAENDDVIDSLVEIASSRAAAPETEPDWEYSVGHSNQCGGYSADADMDDDELCHDLIEVSERVNEALGSGTYCDAMPLRRRQRVWEPVPERGEE